MKADGTRNCPVKHQGKCFQKVSSFHSVRGMLIHLNSLSLTWLLSLLFSSPFFSSMFMLLGHLLQCDEQWLDSIVLFIVSFFPQKPFSWLTFSGILLVILFFVLTKTRVETPFHLGVKIDVLSTFHFSVQMPVKGNVSLSLYYQEVYMRSFRLIQKLKVVVLNRGSPINLRNTYGVRFIS